ERLLTVEHPHDTEALPDRKLEQARSRRRRISHAGAHTPAIVVVFPAVKRALHAIAYDTPHGEVCPEMRTIGARHSDDSVLTAINDHAAIEEVAPDHLPRCDLARQRDRKPGLA